MRGDWRNQVKNIAKAIDFPIFGLAIMMFNAS
jgi:hypothetical protein